MLLCSTRRARAFLLPALVIVYMFCGETSLAQRRIHQPCPSGCVCIITGTTVRCMHRRLTRVPRVPDATRILDLRFNHIRDIAPGAFQGLRNLHTLLLNNNHIRQIPADSFKGLTSLKHLYLYKNRINNIHQDAFKGLLSLEQLYLYNNDISSLEVGTMSNLPKLERLFLHNNMLTSLPDGLFDRLSSLKRLRLDNNQLVCDCDLLWFAKMLLSLGGNIQATATCHSPRHLFGRSISTVPLREFKCTAPTIVSEPHSTQVEPGATIYMSCTANGSPQPTIIWYHNRLIIIAADVIDIGNCIYHLSKSFVRVIVPDDARRRKSVGGSLIIMNARNTDEGTYKCMATNTVGSAESREVQIVYRGSSTGPPFFMALPQNVEVRLNDPTTLECRAAGKPEPDIIWMKDGQRIAARDTIFFMNSGSLHLRRVHLADNGTYTCVAMNSEGRVNTSADIIVRSPPVYTERPDNTVVLQGASAILSCHATGNPVPTITWLKNGRRLSRDQRYLIMSSGSLLIRVVNPDDEGKYSCIIQNSVGRSQADADISVRVAPHFIVRPQNQRVRQGTTVDFQCQASGRPQPHIVWTKNRRAIPDDSRYNILASGTLRILQAETSDAGIYRCEAANSLGARGAEVTLEIIPFQELQFVRTPSDMTVDSGTQVQLPCHVRADTGSEFSPVTISWAKDSVGIVSSDERYAITQAPSSYLTIADVGRDDAGRYECIARSGPTVIRASMTLSVNVRSSTEEIVDKLMEILPPGCLQQGCHHVSLHPTRDGVYPTRPEDYDEATVDSILRAHLRLDDNIRFKRQADGFRSPLHELTNSVNLVARNIDGAINNTIQHFNDRLHRQSPSDLLALMRFPSTRRGVNMMRAAEIFEVSLKMIECCIQRGSKPKRFTFDHSSIADHENNLSTPTPTGTFQGSFGETQVLDSFDVKEDDNANHIPLPFIGTEVVALVANLSGCSAHQKVPDCSDKICFHRKYRTPDGTCNNLQHPMWGASLTPFHRLLKPIYENGFNSPIGWKGNKLYNGHALPSSRQVSLDVLMSREPRPSTDAELTHMTMQWGQFVDHDLDFTTMAPSIKRFSDGVACKDSCDNEAPCFPINVASNDPRHHSFQHHSSHHGQRTQSRNLLDGSRNTCMEFTRSSAVCGSGITSVFFSSLSRREQINQITSYQDASNVYGSTEEETNNLRDRTSDLGLLKEGQPLETGQKPLLPYNIYSDLDSGSTQIRPVAPIECRRGDSETPQERSVPCFLCGDLRCNEQVSLTSMHTLWMREHNRIARRLKEINSEWGGETIYQEARKIVGAQMQHITYSHWLPKILGPYMNFIQDYKTYDPNTPASIVNVFATAAFRFGHTMINPIMYRLNRTWGETEYGNLMLHQAFFAPYRIIHEGGVDPLIRGLIAKPMKARDADSNMNSELIERLFALAEEVALDLGSLNIQRGRDHALPFYNEWRELCNLTRARTFDDLSGEIRNKQVRERLQRAYGSVDNIDPFVGMILEDITQGSRLGPTLGCIIGKQFKRVRDGDRLWYENPGVFSPAQLTEIRQVSLAGIICDNTDGISSVPRDVFLNTPTPDFISCNEIPKVDLRAWTECCEGCSGRTEGFDTLSAHLRRGHRRSKRSTDKFESDLKPKTKRRKHRKRKKGNDFVGGPYSANNVTYKSLVDGGLLAFDELVPGEGVDNKKNTEALVNIAEALLEEHISRDERTQSHHGTEVREEDKQAAVMDELLKVVKNLEAKVNSLQTEVQRLHGNLEDSDLPK